MSLIIMVLPGSMWQENFNKEKILKPDAEQPKYPVKPPMREVLLWAEFLLGV